MMHHMDTKLGLLNLNREEMRWKSLRSVLSFEIEN